MKIDAVNIEKLKFDESGLIVAIIQDATTLQVRMVGWMNRDSILQTLQSKRVTFWSRSREELWEKGATSGNFLELVSISTDCDRDSLLVLVTPMGPTCHEGSEACFIDSPKTETSFLEVLQQVIVGRDGADTNVSYTSRLLAEGRGRVAQKVGEEGVETALSVASGEVGEVIAESADLIFHLLVALRHRGVSIADVVNELARRRAEAVTA